MRHVAHEGLADADVAAESTVQVAEVARHRVTDVGLEPEAPRGFAVSEVAVGADPEPRLDPVSRVSPGQGTVHVLHLIAQPQIAVPLEPEVRLPDILVAGLAAAGSLHGGCQCFRPAQ